MWMVRLEVNRKEMKRELNEMHHEMNWRFEIYMNRDEDTGVE